MLKYQDMDAYQKLEVVAMIKEDLRQICGSDPRRLEHFGFKVHSQSDEDGIINEIFRRIGTTNRCFVEFGAEVGLENNTRFLLQQGWNGLWIEGNEDYAGSITWTYRNELASGQLYFISAFADRDNINSLIQSSGISGEIDLLSIDIDGNDWHVWNAIEVISPRVVVAEHNHRYKPPSEYIMPYDPNYRWGPKAPPVFGSSLSSNCTLAEKKGYRLVGCGLYSSNAFFVRKNLLADHFPWDYAPESHWRRLDYKKVLKYPMLEYGT